MSVSLSPLPYALGTPLSTATLKESPEDFVVTEVLGFEPSGSGEHVFLWVEKRGENTEYVARQIARVAGVKSRDVSYAGLKDRHARTLQWFSVQLPGKADPDWSALQSATIQVLKTIRNDRKLRRGSAKGNCFELTLRHLNGSTEALIERLEAIKAQGVPNYFGQQRFGREGDNVEKALAFFKDPNARIDPHLRGLYLSAARSELFNQILAKRVCLENWNLGIDGDVFMFPDSKSFFGPEPMTAELSERLNSHRIHPSAVLWGETPSTAQGSALAIEEEATAPLQELCEGLKAARLETARRPLRLTPMDLTWSFEDPEVLKLFFTLPAGAYATTLVRELVMIEETSA